MSRSHRDNQRRLDQKATDAWRDNYYNRHLLPVEEVAWASWGNRIWRSIPRYSQGRRKYFAGIKRMKKHLIKNYVMHDRIYGHHMTRIDDE